MAAALSPGAACWLTSHTATSPRCSIVPGKLVVTRITPAGDVYAAIGGRAVPAGSKPGDTLPPSAPLAAGAARPANATAPGPKGSRKLLDVYGNDDRFQTDDHRKVGVPAGASGQRGEHWSGLAHQVQVGGALYAGWHARQICLSNALLVAAICSMQPWSAIGFINSGCTATLVGPRTLLTAGKPSLRC